jgi:hypothetical protein
MGAIPIVEYLLAQGADANTGENERGVIFGERRFRPLTIGY